MTPIERLERWLDEAIIGLDLCPFAAKVRREAGVRILTLSIHDPMEAVRATLEEVRALVIGQHEGVQTTLVAITDGLEDFETYLDVVATVEAAIEESGAEGFVQVATFHPDYRFAETDPEDVSQFTNRSPYPVLHLLREADVSEAVDRHPNPAGIPETNIARLEAMGQNAVRELWAIWSRSP